MTMIKSSTWYFVDFKQAYDSINRDKLGIVLINLGILNKLIKIKIIVD